MQDISTLPERFWKKVDRSGGVDACWPWLAATVNGYPVYRNPVDRLVRRYLWFILNGEVPKGQVVSCQVGNSLCVNPTHLVKRSIKERTALAMGKGTHRSPFVSCLPKDRAEYAARAKGVVDQRGTRHAFTAEQRTKGHATRGCVVGGATPRSSYDIPIAERRILLKDPCVYCGGPASEIDHIQPYANAGSYDWSNRAPACLSCNRSKNNLGLLKFLLKRQQACI